MERMDVGDYVSHFVSRLSPVLLCGSDCRHGRYLVIMVARLCQTVNEQPNESSDQPPLERHDFAVWLNRLDYGGSQGLRAMR